MQCSMHTSKQGRQRRGDAEARGADFYASDGGARRRFEVGGVNFVVLCNFYVYASVCTIFVPGFMCEYQVHV